MAAPDRSPVATVLVVAGLGIALTGLFALPVQSHDRARGGDVGFIQLRQLAVLLTDRGTSSTRDLMSVLARFWFRYGLLTVTVLLIVATCAVVAQQNSRPAVLTAGGLALVGGVVHGVALAQTADYFSALALFRNSGSLYTDAGLGTWIGFAGLAAIIVGAVIGLLPLGATAPSAPPTPVEPRDPYLRVAADESGEGESGEGLA